MIFSKQKTIFWQILYAKLKSYVATFLSKNLSIFPETQQFFNSRQKLKENPKLKAKTQRFLPKKLKVPEVFTTGTHGKTAPQKSLPVHSDKFNQTLTFCQIQQKLSSH